MLVVSKEELIKRLREDNLYKEALKLLGNDADRARVISTAESFVSSFYDSMRPVVSMAERDQKFAEKLSEALGGVRNVVRESDGRIVASGSLR